MGSKKSFVQTQTKRTHFHCDVLIRLESKCVSITSTLTEILLFIRTLTLWSYNFVVAILMRLLGNGSRHVAVIIRGKISGGHHC